MTIIHGIIWESDIFHCHCMIVNWVAEVGKSMSQKDKLPSIRDVSANLIEAYSLFPIAKA